MLRRILTPLVLAALFLLPGFAPGVLCSCGGPARPEPEPAATPGPVSPAVVEPAPTAETPPAGAAPAAQPAGLPDFSDPSFTRTPSATGAFVVAWRSTPAAIPRNEEFALDVWLLFDGQPRQVSQLGISGWMPDHGHGMLRNVRAEPRPDGSYHVENMLLHMRGNWLLIFDVLEGSVAERAEHSFELR